MRFYCPGMFHLLITYDREARAHPIISRALLGREGARPLLAPITVSAPFKSADPGNTARAKGVVSASSMHASL